MTNSNITNSLSNEILQTITKLKETEQEFGKLQERLLNLSRLLSKNMDELPQLLDNCPDLFKILAKYTIKWN